MFQRKNIKKSVEAITFDDLIKANDNKFFISDTLAKLIPKEEPAEKILSRLTIGMKRERLIQYVVMNMNKIITSGNDQYIEFGVLSSLKCEDETSVTVYFILSVFITKLQIEETKANMEFKTVFTLISTDEVDMYNEATDGDLIIVRDKGDVLQ